MHMLLFFVLSVLFLACFVVGQYNGYNYGSYNGLNYAGYYPSGYGMIMLVSLLGWL